ncbi:hypothetical protein VTJ83DRAFT_4192 [Remersonia thermophila]|uniref:Uncharacterized protein n=1 Tax=Remersonia thermophila TaxID=72144 RepID=A0ABR4D9B9_9PEZI
MHADPLVLVVVERHGHHQVRAPPRAMALGGQQRPLHRPLGRRAAAGERARQPRRRRALPSAALPGRMIPSFVLPWALARGWVPVLPSVAVAVLVLVPVPVPVPASVPTAHRARAVRLLLRLLRQQRRPPQRWRLGGRGGGGGGGGGPERRPHVPHFHAGRPPAHADEIAPERFALPGDRRLLAQQPLARALLGREDG